ncbi:metallo-dependent phosphatase [Phanerochaete sordida]|uniref:Metallo-dependent phosphatase n=1 Tax=Phanerochaete sordida TaxID=48140 RepID=A0A9P3LA89_9APHY|nr:metallo-dependent phosphatase [Phanerochaete sordida]
MPVFTNAAVLIGLASFGLRCLAAPAMEPRVLSIPSALNPYPTKPRLTFKSDGTFKVTIFSDLHFGENAWDVWGPQQDVNSTRLMNTVLASEKPDFIVLNGDQITGENTFRENSTVYIDEILAPINSANIPFCSTQGNHDNQVNITHTEEIQRELSHTTLSYTRINPAGGKYAPGTYWVPVYAHKNDFQPALIIWAFDSEAGVSEGANSTALPDFVQASVASWIEQETSLMDEYWGPADKTRGALAFVHIPPHAVQAVWETLNSTVNPGLNADSLGVGSTQASGTPANAGKDQPFWDALNANVKNLHAVISGHDHGDEWCAREPTKDVIFCFDKHSGYGGYSSDGWGHGVRNIVFSTPDPSVGPETWIRLEEGETRARITLDKNYQ